MISTRRLFQTISKSSQLKQQLYFKPQQTFFWGKKKAKEVPQEIENVDQMISKENIQNVAVDSQTVINQEVAQAAAPIQPEVISESVLDQGEQLSAAASNGIDFKINNSQFFQNTYVPEMDLGNIANSMAPLNEYQHLNILDKLSYCSPGSIYEQLDQFSRDLLFHLAEPSGLGWGLGLSIAFCSLSIKLVFMPLMTYTQINALKMKLIEPEMKNFQAQSQALQKRGDYAGLKEAQKQFYNLRKSHGINNWVTLLSLGQIPILITWFLSLRYVCSMPDKFPGLKTEGLLWFQDLSEADPYFILPLISASLSYLNISMNPNLQNSAGGNVFSKYMRYFKFLPFVSLPIVAFFPSGLNVYWAITAATHLAVGLLVRSKFMRYNLFKIPEYLPGTILERLNQKHTQKVIKTTIIDDQAAKKEAINNIAMSLTGKPVPNKQQAQTSPKKGEGVQVFANKPTKKKKK